MAEDVTVLIANLGRLEHIRPCLRSIFDGAGRSTSLRVIIGFNFEGGDDTPRTLAGEFPRAEQFRAPAKLGYCRAYNQLMAQSTGRYLLLLDDDTVLAEGAIDGMVRFIAADRDEQSELGHVERDHRPQQFLSIPDTLLRRVNFINIAVWVLPAQRVEVFVPGPIPVGRFVRIHERHGRVPQLVGALPRPRVRHDNREHHDGEKRSHDPRPLQPRFRCVGLFALRPEADACRPIERVLCIVVGGRRARAAAVLSNMYKPGIAKFDLGLSGFSSTLKTFFVCFSIYYRF